MNSSEEIGFEIDELFKEELSLDEKIDISFSLIQLVPAWEQKPPYALWKLAFLNPKELTLEEITSQISLLSLVYSEFRELNHMEMHSFLRRINPNREKIEVSEKEKTIVKNKFLSILKNYKNVA